MSKQHNRNYVLLFSILITLTCGTPYFWSIFQLFFTETIGWATSKALFVFSLQMTLFPIGTIVGGRIQDTVKSHLVVRYAGIGVGVFLMLSSFAATMAPALGHPYLCVMYGLASFCSGAVYNAVLPTVQKWFPDKKGFASGLVVAATGFGGIVFTPFVEFFLGLGGASSAFIALGITYLIVVLISSFFVAPPAEGYLPAGYVPKQVTAGSNINLTTKEMLKTSTYYVLLASMSFATLSYLLISPTLKGLCIDRGVSAQIATATVMACALMNSAGRFVNSWLSDKLGKKPTLIGLMLLCSASLLLLAGAKGLFVSLIATVIAFCYGGFLSVYPILTSDLFGMKYAGSNYGFVILATAFSALTAPVLLNFTKDLGGVSVAIFCAAAISVAAAVLMLTLQKPKAKV